MHRWGIFDYPYIGALITRVAKFTHGGSSIRDQTVFVSRVDPCSCHHPRTIAWADFVLVGIDQRIKRRPINEAFFNQQGFERLHSQSDVGGNVLVNVIFSLGGIQYGGRARRSDGSSQEIASRCH
jgi:hypothetical protein